MKIPYFSKDRILADDRLKEFWAEPALDLDHPMGLDRAIMHATTDQFFCRQMMKNELNAEFVGGKPIFGTEADKEKVQKEVHEKNMLSNARIVMVIDRQKGIRFKDFAWVFALPTDLTADVPDPVIAFLKRGAKQFNWPK